MKRMIAAERWTRKVLLVVALLIVATPAWSRVELSLQGSYYKTKYPEIGDNSYSATRRVDIGLGYYFTAVTEFEASYYWSKNQTELGGIQSIETVDQLISLDWNQTLVPPDFTVQPYFKLGVGISTKSQTGEVLSSSGAVYNLSTTDETKELTGVLGLGMRMYLTRSFALKFQYITYIPKFDFKELKNNFGFTGGLSWMF